MVGLYGTSGGHDGWSRVAVSLRQEVSVSLDVLYVRGAMTDVWIAGFGWLWLSSDACEGGVWSPNQMDR